MSETAFPLNYTMKTSISLGSVCYVIFLPIKLQSLPKKEFLKKKKKKNHSQKNLVITVCVLTGGTLTGIANGEFSIPLIGPDGHYGN